MTIFTLPFLSKFTSEIDSRDSSLLSMSSMSLFPLCSRRVGHRVHSKNFLFTLSHFDNVVYLVLLKVLISVT